MEFYIFKSQEVIERQTSKFDQSTISFPLPKELKEARETMHFRSILETQQSSE